MASRKGALCGLFMGSKWKRGGGFSMNGAMAALSVDVGAAADSPRCGFFEPAYLRLFRSGELAERARSACQHLKNCDLCARYCRVDRRLAGPHELIQVELTGLSAPSQPSALWTLPGRSAQRSRIAELIEHE